MTKREGFWNDTKEVAGNTWDKTKDIGVHIWEKTKEATGEVKDFIVDDKKEHSSSDTDEECNHISHSKGHFSHNQMN